MKPFVWEADGELSLHFELSSIQSRMSLSDPGALALDYTRAMMGCLFFVPEPRSVLMIGLGGGSVPKYCHRHLRQLDLTVVEINPHVIALREQFLVPPDDAHFRVVCADGADFVAQGTARYDIVMVDGFNYEGQPEVLCTPEFYAACRERLAPEGLLVVNLHAEGDLEHRLLARLEACFEAQVVSLMSEDGGNRVVFAGAPVQGGVAAAQRHAGRLDRVHRDTLARIRPALWRALSARSPQPEDSRWPEPQADDPPPGRPARGRKAQRTRRPGTAPGKGSST